jgi:hypothetical protein
MVYLPNAVVSHSHRLSLAGFVRQYFRYGRGAARFHRENLRRGGGGLWANSGLHRGWRTWLFRPWREESGFRAMAFLLLMMVWQTANLAGFLYGWLFETE